MTRFMQAYVECALWSSSDGENGEIRLDEYDGDIAPQTLAAMEADCAGFQANNADLLAAWYDIGEDETHAGHDFWLTRNGHGAGFWDRYYIGTGVELGNKLTAAAKKYGEVDLYIGADGLIYGDAR
jgi:hypothetical protein